MIGYDRALGGEVPREDLLARVRAAHPALLVLSAPAGFGKSTFARQATSGEEHAGIADCAGAQQAVDLARAVLCAFADAFPDRRDELARHASILGDASIPLEEQLSTLTSIWRQPQPPSTIVFENAEHAMQGPTRDLLARLLAERPVGRRIVACTREPLRLHLSRFLPPHQILTLHAADLAFTADEVRRALGNRTVAAAQFERIVRISRGWPIAVFLFLRFADESRLDALLDKLDAADYDDLYEYVVDQVVETMPFPLRDALLFCSLVPDAGESDIEVALGPEPAEALERASRESPFVRKRENVYEVHPLAASALRAAAPDLAHAIVGSAADQYARRGDARNAARLFLAAGDVDAAAVALDRAETVLELDLARMATALPNDVRRRFPIVWGAAVMVRLWQTAVEETRSEAEAIWDACGGDTPVATRLFVGFTYVLYEQYVGRFPQALALLDDLQRTIAGWAIAPDDAVERRRQLAMVAYLHYFRGLVLARCGALRDAERELSAPNLAAASAPIVSGLHLIAGADIARLRGERDAERREIDEACKIVSAVGLRNYVARCTAEAAIGAWLAGEDHLVSRLAADLDELVEQDGVFALGFLAAMLRGREREPRAADLMIYVCFGHLIAAAHAPPGATRQGSLAGAREVAERFSAPYTIVLTNLALATAAEAPDQERLFVRAREAAAQIDDAPELLAAVDDAARGGTGGFLAPFLARYRNEDSAGDALDAVRICFADGRVLRAGAEVKLGRVPEALLFALAEDPRGLSVAALLERFWDDVDPDAARNALKVTLWRLRKALGHVTIRAGDGVLLTGVTVDMWDAQRAYRSALDAGDPSRREALLREAHALWEGERPAYFAQWEWFDPIARRIGERRAEVAALLARIALESGRPDDARRLGEKIAAYDPLDEVGAEIVVRAHLAHGDRAEALRCFRRYRTALRSELDCDPSAAFTQLVHE
ncbi:MAG: signal transduction response regulator [Candidatus Eremiobacteraeota bacterium]|nr:signal transduction response regulator [Candidatus Eremiobacteraeota bacterium]